MQTIHEIEKAILGRMILAPEDMDSWQTQVDRDYFKKNLFPKGEF